MPELWKEHGGNTEMPYHLHHIVGSAAATAGTLPLHYDKDVVVVYFRRGGGSARIEGQYYPIEEGDVILLNPRELHCFTFREGEHERVVLYIREELLRNFYRPNPGFFKVFYDREPGKGNCIPAETAAENGIQELLERILRLNSDSSGWRDMLTVCRIVDLVAAIEKLQSSIPSVRQENIPENSVVSEILHYINENFLNISDTEQVAGYFFLERAYLCRTFKHAVGISLWNYVIMRRLVFSNDLIRSGVSIEEAAYRAGFQNYSNFFRLYKKYFGITPSEFRRQQRT